MPTGLPNRYHLGVSLKVLFAAGLSLAAASVVGGGTLLYCESFPAGRALPGTYVGGRLEPPDESLGSWLERRRRELLDREVVVRTPEAYRVSTLGELGIELDVAETMETVLQHAREGSLGARLRRAWASRQGLTDLPLTLCVDEVKARARLEEYAQDAFREPVNARLDLEAHRRVPARSGRELDTGTSLARVRALAAEGGSLVRLATRAVPAAVTTDMLAAVDVSQVLSSFETGFSDSSRGRARNIELAAKLLSGNLIAPGQTLSFNQTVGPRRIERGFTWAPVIIDDELRPGVGGGTCQVASTLHGAAVLGLVDVVQRRSHSRPSGYAKLGLDAAVIYGEVDLNIRNPYDTPLIIHAFVPKHRTLRVELLGRPPPGEVHYSYGVQRSYEFYRRVTTKPWLGPGRRIRKQKGIRGYDVVSVVRVVRPDGTSSVSYYSSEYRPTPEVYWVGPEHDLSDLPDLPDGATYVELDGERVADLSVEENPYL